MTNKELTKFNIVVPTRERPDTLYHCLRTILTQEYENFEIIVSDNFSQDNTEQVVKSFGDRRIRYVNTGRRISMSHNFEFAISQVNDGWVTTLGDDDGLLPGALARIDRTIRETGTEAVISPWCHYFWPGVTDQESTLILPLGQGWERRNSAAWLARLMKGYAHYAELPMLYTGGFASKAAIDRARGKDGMFYHSLNPDMYSAIALASVMENYVYLREPVAIAGVSAHSNGASCLGITTNAEPAIKFFSENNIEFHPTLDGSKIKSIPIFVYESYLQTSFLHNNFLRLELSTQLSLALGLADTAWQDEMSEYCTRVAKKNGLDIDRISRESKQVRRFFRLAKILARCKRALSDVVGKKMVRLNVSPLGASNVFETSLVARTLWASLAENRSWRRSSIADAMKTCFSSGSGANKAQGGRQP